MIAIVIAMFLFLGSGEEDITGYGDYEFGTSIDSYLVDDKFFESYDTDFAARRIRLNEKEALVFSSKSSTHYAAVELWSVTEEENVDYVLLTIRPNEKETMKEFSSYASALRILIADKYEMKMDPELLVLDFDVLMLAYKDEDKDILTMYTKGKNLYIEYKNSDYVSAYSEAKLGDLHKF